MPCEKMHRMEAINMGETTPLSPETLTAVEIFESISATHKNQALEILRNFAQELRSEQNWEQLYSNHHELMKKMAAQARKEHREGKSRRM